jgi:hypothetical protein
MLAAKHWSSAMIRALCTIAAGAVVLLLAANAEAAPIPPLGPLDLCGDVVSQSWQPERFVAGKPGFSGSLGRDRTFPARFRVVLQNYRGIDPATAGRINGYLSIRPEERGDGAPRVVLLLSHANARFLDGVVSLCVEGFHISGDEGGTWTRYRTLSVQRR